MTNLTVKKIPDDLYESLRESARRNRRSINSEVIVCFERTFRHNRVDPEQLLARVRKIRATIDGAPLTEEILKKAKKWGRP